MLVSKRYLTVLIPVLITMTPCLAAAAEDIVDVGHHTVHYLGTSDNGPISTAAWAITENGCADSSALSAEPRAAGGNGKGGGKGGGNGGGKDGKNCNSMSHAAFADFLCNPSALVWPDSTGEQLYETVTDEQECLNGQYTCLHTYYQPNYGASRPDGPGDWIKFSNHTSDPQTGQLSVGNTHVFAISFYNSGYDPDGETHVAIKIGKTVVIGLVPAPSCPSP